MSKERTLNQDNFSKLLDWLGNDEDSAGQRYEKIRFRLVKIFYARGCQFAEELADETINRVAVQVESIAENYEGNPAIYFYGVAKKVFLENTRKPLFTELSDNLKQNSSNTDELELYDKCLEKCLNKLGSDKKEFILSYYEKDKQAKIDHRRKMQEDMELSSESFRLRAFRIRNKLQKCVFRCVEQSSF